MASAPIPAPSPDHGAGPSASPRTTPDFTIITGLSGAGRSEAAKCLEDLGYFVVDNLPPALIGKMAELATAPGGPERVAIVADARAGVFFAELSRGLRDLDQLRIPYRILFLQASDEDLLRRFEATRHRHPLDDGGLVDGIRRERAMMESLKERADLIIDTSGMSPHDLRERVRDAFGVTTASSGMRVSVVSFGFKFGVPRDVDLLFDVRFLPNPHWVDELRPLPGSDPHVRDYVASQEPYRAFMKRLTSLLDVTVPGYVSEGKAYLTVGVGCTGGRHRSVVVSEELARYFEERGFTVSVDHRDLDRE